MRHLAILIALAAALAGGSAEAGCLLKPVAELPVTMTAGRQPRISATVDGAPVSFLLDSGAFFSSLSANRAAALKLRITPVGEGAYVIGVGGVSDLGQTRVTNFGFAGAMLHNVTFAVVHNDVADLIGQNVLGLADAEYDLGAGMVRLMRPFDCGGRPLSYWAPGIRPSSAALILLDEGLYPRGGIAVMVNGTPIRAMLDTGAGSSLITAKAAARLGLKAEDGATGSTNGLGRRTVATYVARIDNLELGDEEIKNTRLVVIDDPLVLAGVDMILGADFFLSHHVYVSKTQGRVYFTYNGGAVFAPPQGGGVADANQGPLKDAGAYARRGAASESRGEQRQAIDDYDRAVALAPDDADLLAERAGVYARAGKIREAIADLDKSLRLKPGQPAVLLDRAALRTRDHDEGGAVSDLKEADRAIEDDSDLRLALGMGFQDAGRPADAITQVDLWIAHHRDNTRLADALTLRCRARALSNRDLDKALADCNGAMRSNPKSIAALDSRGLVFLRLGQFERAIADYDASLAIQPKSAWSLYGRGLAKLSAGKVEGGKSDLASAAALDSGVGPKAAKYGLKP